MKTIQRVTHTLGLFFCKKKNLKHSHGKQGFCCNGANHNPTFSFIIYSYWWDTWIKCTAFNLKLYNGAQSLGTPPLNVNVKRTVRCKKGHGNVIERVFISQLYSSSKVILKYSNKIQIFTTIHNFSHEIAPSDSRCIFKGCKRRSLNWRLFNMSSLHNCISIVWFMCKWRKKNER